MDKQKKSLYYGEFKDLFPYELTFDEAITRLNEIKEDISKNTPEFADDIRLVMDTHISQGDYDYGDEIFNGIDIIAYRDETDAEYADRLQTEEMRRIKKQAEVDARFEETRQRRLQQYHELKENLTKEGLI